MRSLARYPRFLSLVLIAIAMLGGAPQVVAQSQPPDTPAAGGPQGQSGPIILPKKKTEEEKPAPKPEKIKNPEGLGDFSIRTTTNLVTVDANVITKDGQFIPGLKKENFKITEDGVPQSVQKLEQGEAPITAVMLLEFAQPNPGVNRQGIGGIGGPRTYSFIYDMLNASYIFASQLKREDWVAVVSYDIKPTMLQDFTQDKRQVRSALSRLRQPAFWETNMFDALYDTLDRLEGIEGRKYVVLICSGIDTFSKLTLSKILDKVKATRDITIYAVGTGGAFRAQYDQYFGPIQSLDLLQADNQLKTFAGMTGGRAYFPRFVGEMPDVFREIAQSIRNQYLITYSPTNKAQDGSYRKIKVELQGENGGPLLVQDQKGKKLKYQVIHRDGYRAKPVVQ
ncbi:MAG: VWA domain-containing protein [Acidobacteriales bacterium]|nr:VWA domain-containing protein [Terriglobales bacterium]